jgi:hypothetical protein
MLGDNQEESTAIYVFTDDSSNLIDEGGNRGYNNYSADKKFATYCNGIYVNNEDECVDFIEQPLQQFEIDPMEYTSSQNTCTNTKGVFLNHLGDLKRCLWLLNDSRRSLNCNGLSELGRMCRKSCLEDCSKPIPSNNEDETTTRKSRRQRKKEKIMKRRQREREEKGPTNKPTQRPSSKEPTNKPTRPPSAHPSAPNYHSLSPKPTIKPHKNKHRDIIFYVIGDAPYKVSELDPITGFPLQVRGIPNDAEFVIHVGDILSAKESECHLSWYQQVSSILRSSNAPVFITPGDNDWLGKYTFTFLQHRLVYCHCPSHTLLLNSRL